MAKLPLGVAIVLLALFALLFALASAQPPPSGAPNPLGEQRFISSEQEKLRVTLNDPDSARFRAAFVSQSGGKPIVCGLVNYRNAMGGYGGYQQFVAGEAARKTRDQGLPGELDALWAQHCGDKPRARGEAGSP